ncbi:hypothetical protein ACIQPQ_33635 [Streptomyces sp. NPDC091281]|uniref:hypothetical protein n=1 Tax=Streptomyces sp. NPDC091281 TaxID=3365985 RepID=UPI00380990B6
MGDDGDHTRLDLDAIKSMANGLGSIKKAFDDIGKLERYAADLGDGDLADKLSDFADNWEISREKLTGEVDALAKLARAAAQAYEEIDHQLAEAIRGAQAPKSKGN